jgi:uncharacterized iron-regulated membrane protein
MPVNEVRGGVVQNPTGDEDMSVQEPVKMSLRDRWFTQPQSVWLRKALFQVHLWIGIGLGLYIAMISVSGVVLIYRNELYRAFEPQPRVVAVSGPRISADEIKQQAARLYPDYEVTDLREGKEPNIAVEVSLTRGEEVMLRVFDPYTGEDLGNPLPVGFRFTAWLLDLHDNLLAGETGRRINGIGAISLVAMSLTGAVIWWPGIRNWRRSLKVDFRANWTRFNWSLHSAAGFWALIFILMWGVTGIYLSYPQFFSSIVDWVEPFDENNPVERVGDRILYWLGYLHFGRFRRRIPGCDETCNSALMAVWAGFGLVLPLMFITGAVMWWKRVLRKRM